MSTTLSPSTQFMNIIPFVLTNEGGYSSDPADSGNWTGGKVNVGTLKGTNYGISAASYPNLDIKNLTKQDAELIYLSDFYPKVGGDNIPTAISFLMLDACVNSGVENAVPWIQAILSLKQDGNCGPVTQTAINAYSDQQSLCEQYCVSHLIHYTQFSSWAMYAKGYTTRLVTDCFVAHSLLSLS
jgi:lysozyme family protein